MEMFVLSQFISFSKVTIFIKALYALKNNRDTLAIYFSDNSV